MTDTSTTATPTDPTFAPEAGFVPSPVRRVAKPLAGLVVGVAIGWFAGSAAADSSPAVTDVPVAPAAVVEAPVTPEGHSVSPDAAARWAEAERQERLELCTSTGSSADALERCMSGPG